MKSVSTLIVKAKAGDRAAMDQLFGICRSYLAVIAEAQVASWAGGKFSASDVVQQSLLDAYQGFDQFRGATTAEWLAWLRRIIGHNACDLARHYTAAGKRAVGREVSARGAMDSGVLEHVAKGDSPSKLAQTHERELLIADALTHLSADHKEVIVLRNLKGLSFEEIAGHLGRSRPAVQMLWMRAVESLRDRMSENSAGSS